MLNATFERLKAVKMDIFQRFSFYEKLKFHALLSCAQKSFITSRPNPIFICISLIIQALYGIGVRLRFLKRFLANSWFTKQSS